MAIRDGRVQSILPSGNDVYVFKRPGDTFLYDLDYKPTLGPEGWLNAFYLEGQETTSGPGTTVISGMTEVDSTHMFQVGYYVDANGRKKPLIQMGNGTTWSNRIADGTAIPLVPIIVNNGTTPVPGGADVHAVLTCCCAVSNTEYYAFGYYQNGDTVIGPNGKTNVYHLKSTDGGATWSYLSTVVIGGQNTPSQPTSGLHSAGDRAVTFCAALATNTIILGGTLTRSLNTTSQTASYAWISKATLTGMSNLVANTSAIPAVVADAAHVITCAAKVSSSVAYIAGYYLSANGSKQTLVYKTTDAGGTYTIVTSPNNPVGGSAVDDVFYGVAVNTSSEIYFVGSQVSTAGGLRSNMVFKFDGTSTWTENTPPQIGVFNNELTACTIDNPGVSGAFLYCGGYSVSNLSPNIGNKVQMRRLNVTTGTWATQTTAALTTNSESVSGMASAGVGEVWLCGQNGGAALSQHFTSSWAIITTTAPIPGVTPPVITPSTIVPPLLPLTFPVAGGPPSGAQTAAQFKISGGTSGWVGSARLFTGVSYPRDAANLASNAYVKHVTLQIVII